MDAADATPDATPDKHAIGMPLVPGRACGECNVCCVALTIRDPALQKVQGVRCQHAASDNGCLIYDTRPMTCRLFHCGWRHLKWVREPMRPDLSGVLVRLRLRQVVAGQPLSPSVVFTLLEPRGLSAAGFLESIAAAVAAGVPTFLEIAGRPGWTAGIAQINDVLADAVLRRDRQEMEAVLQRCVEVAREGADQAVPVRLDG